jgi:hypothetical protein
LQWKFTSLLLAFISLYGCCTADTSESAHLLVSKRVLNEYVVEGRDLTVSYAIYNVGSSPATSVSLVEETFSSDDFEIVSGQLSVRWQSIAPYPFYIMSPYSCCVWMWKNCFRFGSTKHHRLSPGTCIVPCCNTALIKPAHNRAMCLAKFTCDYKLPFCAVTFWEFFIMCVVSTEYSTCWIIFGIGDYFLQVWAQ